MLPAPDGKPQRQDVEVKRDLVPVLEDAVREAKEVLLQSPLIAALTSPDLTFEQYVQFLKRLYGCLHVLEEQIAQTPIMGSDAFGVRGRMKTKELYRDLEICDLNRYQINHLPSASATVANIKTAGHSIGALYVIETLFLDLHKARPNIERVLSLHGSPANHLLALYGSPEETRAKVETYLEAANEFPKVVCGSNEGRGVNTYLLRMYEEARGAAFSVTAILGAWFHDAEIARAAGVA